MDLTLPRIEPAQAVPSAANAIDQAGAQFKQAADKTANVLSEDAKAQIAVQTQEATLQATKGYDNAIQIIKSNPYLSPADARTMFGGNVPQTVNLTEPVPGQPDPKVRQDRKAIPMHEVAPALFDHMTQSVTLAATQNIKDEPWQRNFARAAAKDVETKRVEMLDWQRAQRLADAEIQTNSQLQQAAANRNWNLYTAILDTPENQLGVQQRQAYRENLPLLQTQAAIEDRLRSTDINDLNKLRTDIMGNRAADPSKPEDGGFARKLTAEQQYHFSKLVDERVREVQHQEEWQRKRTEDKRFEDFGDVVQQAVNTSKQTGKPLSSFVSVADIPISMGFAHYENFKRFMDGMAKPPRTENDPNAWMRLSARDKAGTLGQMSRAEIMQEWPNLTEPGREHWMAAWASATKGTDKPMFSAEERQNMEHYLKDNRGYDPAKNKESADRYNSTMSLLEGNMLAWKARNPGVPMSYAIISTEGSTVTLNNPLGGFFFGPKNSSAWVQKNLSDTGSFNALQVGVRQAQGGGAVSVQTLLDHAKQVEKEMPTVDEAWTALNPAAPLDGTARGVVHGVLINRANLEQIDAQLGDKPKTERNRIYQIVANMQIPQSREQAAKNAAQALQDATGRQVVKAGAAQQAQQKAQAAENAKLPWWEQNTNNDIQQMWNSGESAIRNQIEQRVAAEVQKDWQSIVGQPGEPWGPTGVKLQQEAKRRVEAEVAQGQTSRKADFDAQMSEAKAAYNKYMETQLRSNDGTLKNPAFATGPLPKTLAEFIDLRRKGKL